jgi:ubiquinone/menaquinone biosynthesis C-methylase UbiE
MEFTRLSTRYRGDAAHKYDADREQTAKWGLEQAAVESILSALPPMLSVVDVPVGTGRFVELYQKLGMRATGIDVSPDMLARAREKADRAQASITLQEGDIRAIDAPDGAFDAAVCIRFLNWVDLDGVRGVLNELTRVADRYLVVSISHFLPLRDIDLFSRYGVRSLAGQLARRFKTQVMRNTRRKRIIFHEERALTAAITDAGLKVAKAICTEPGSRGVRSFVYLLEKTDPPRSTNR